MTNLDLTPYATRYQVPARWTSTATIPSVHEITLPAIVCVSFHKDSWCVCVEPDGWAALWLCDTPSDPWVFWQSNRSDFQRFSTAAGALSAACSTSQVAVVEEQTP